MTKLRFCTLTAVFFFITYICSGCRQQIAAPSSVTGSYQSGKTNVLIPNSTGEQISYSRPLSLDFSHTDQGYFTGIISGSNSKINLQVTGPDQIVYQYFIDEPEQQTVFPLTAGDGTYVILAFEQIHDNQYAALLSQVVDVTLENEYLPYLYPNQYVDFSVSSDAVQLAEELSADAPEDLDALKAIYTYITDSITYDTEKARLVESGYLPDIDETLSTGTGICFDYAALATAMLRSLSIPTRLEIGYSNDVRHAWIDVYIQSMGWIDNAIEFNGDEWNLLDPTFAASAPDSGLVNDYIGDGSNYTLQYIR